MYKIYLLFIYFFFLFHVDAKNFRLSLIKVNPVLLEGFLEKKKTLKYIHNVMHSETSI